MGNMEVEGAETVLALLQADTQCSTGSVGRGSECSGHPATLGASR